MATKATSQTGNDVIVTLTVELLGVGLLALLAGSNDKLGTIIVIIMVGYLIGWTLIHTNQLENWVKKA